MDSLAYECFQTGNTFLQIVDVLVGHLYEVCESVTEFRVGEAAVTTLRIFRAVCSPPSVNAWRSAWLKAIRLASLPGGKSVSEAC